LPGDGALLKCAGRLFARGLYGHAPSAYRWDLAGSWKTLTGHAGMADGKNGTVVFIIVGDGKELWRSKKIEAGGLAEYTVGVDRVKELELRVTNADDGNASDWGVWLDPVLTR
jgi:hypothetical protein